MLSWTRYLFMILLLMVPVAVVDDTIGNIESIDWRYTARLLLLLISLAVVRLIPAPAKG